MRAAGRPSPARVPALLLALSWTLAPVPFPLQAQTRPADGVERAPEGADEVTAVSSDLVPVPRPNLDAMEPAVRAQLAENRAVLDTLLERPDVPDSILAAAFGGLGQFYLLYSLNEAADPAFANAQTLAPDDFRWAYFRGALAEEDGRLDAAAEQFERALELMPEDLPTLLHLGRVEVDRNRPEAAAPYFERVLEGRPDSAAALHGLGEVAVARNDYENAVDLFERALDHQPEADTIHYQLGLAYRELGDLEQARAHLRRRGQEPVRFPDPLIQGLSTLSAGSGVHMVQGNRAFADGNYEHAAIAYRRATEANPDDLTPRKALASALAMTGDREGALEEFREVLRREPDDAITHYNVATLLIQGGEIEGALRHFRRAVELAPDFADAHYNLGTTLEGLDRFAEAEKHLARAIELDPQTADARLHRARILDRLGRAEEGIRELEALHETRPEDPAILLSLGSVLARQGRSDDALAHYRAILELEDAADGDRAEARRLVGTIRLEEGDLERAIEELRTASALDPTSYETEMTLANALGRAGRFRDAAERFDRAAALRPTAEEAHFGRATALLLGGREERARARLEESLETLPESVPLRHALARLLAAAAAPETRDGERALELARRVVGAQPTLDHAETVAMALAELRRFEEAVALQRRIVAQAERAGRPDLAAMRGRLDAYEQGRPVRAPWR